MTYKGNMLFNKTLTQNWIIVTNNSEKSLT